MNNITREKEERDRITLASGMAVWVPKGTQLSELQVQAIANAAAAIRPLAKVVNVTMHRDFNDTNSIHSLNFRCEYQNNALNRDD